MKEDKGTVIMIESPSLLQEDSMSMIIVADSGDFSVSMGAPATGVESKVAVPSSPYFNEGQVISQLLYQQK